MIVGIALTTEYCQSAVASAGASIPRVMGLFEFAWWKTD